MNSTTTSVIFGLDILDIGGIFAVMKTPGQILFEAMGGGALIKGILVPPNWDKQPQHLKAIFEDNAVKALGGGFTHPSGVVYRFRANGTIYSWKTAIADRRGLIEIGRDRIYPWKQACRVADLEIERLRAVHVERTMRELITGWNWKGKNGPLGDNTFDPFQATDDLLNSINSAEKVKKHYLLVRENESKKRCAILEVKG